MIHARDLRKRYGTFTAVDRISFGVNPGEILGLIGPNGAGKTTTLKMVAGLVEPTAGEARIGELPSRDPKARALLGYLPEESAVYDDMTPGGYLRFFARLYDVPKAVADERAARVLDALDLEHRDRALGDMSKGMRRKVAIARTLVHDPKVLLLDEPASGLDPLATATVLEFIDAEREAGRAIVFSAHNLFHVERLCDNLVILDHGRAVAQGSVAQVLEEGGGPTYHVHVDVPLPDARAHDGHHVVEVEAFAEVERVRRETEAAGGHVLDVRTHSGTLEELFIRLTRGER